MKTVYILGAGFSVEAGAPTQLNILKETMRLFDKNPLYFDSKRFSIFRRFLTRQLNVPTNKISSMELEDIFTPLDRCLSDNIQFRGISLTNIMNVRESVFYVISRTIQLVLQEANKSKSYIDDFANYLVSKSSERANGNYHDADPVSVISTNWDILLDKSIYDTINLGKHEGNAVVDYCCYISSKDEHDKSVKPGLEKLGQGGFNVKLLKLHGSLNWLQCPRCMRLYVQFHKKIELETYECFGSCRHCDRNFEEEAGKHILTSNLIMPTFIKDLSNPQYKIIWQNAGIEISEAEKIVFIGYSLPSADFEMRQLLSRMTRKSTMIEVVDFIDKREANFNDFKSQREKHWKKFFGKRKVAFHFNGASNYIADLVQQDAHINKGNE